MQKVERSKQGISKFSHNSNASIRLVSIGEYITTPHNVCVKGSKRKAFLAWAEMKVRWTQTV